MRLNKPVYLNTLRWFLDSPARLVSAGLMALLAWGMVGGMAHVEINGVAQGATLATPSSLAAVGNKVLVLLAWILGVGVIRREVDSGAIQLVLLRPLERSSYILSKWAALATLNLAFVAFVYLALLLRGGAGLFDADLLALAGSQAMQVLALCSVLTLLSAVPLGLGELGLGLLAAVTLLALGHYGDRPGLQFLDFVSTQGFRVLFPGVAVENGGGIASIALGGGGQVLSASSAVFNAVVTVAGLAGAMGLLARREFSYSDGGGGA